jgi:hypothetical protein
MWRATMLFLACGLLLNASPAFAQRAELAKARALYNERQFDAAIEAAKVAHSFPTTADAAAIVAARAYLERYRERADAADLAAARAALTAVHPAGLDPRDRVEFLLGLGESLFLENDFGAAAEIFETGIAGAAYHPELQDALLEWWASAIDRHSTNLPHHARRAGFERIAERMSAEIGKNPASPVAGYWMVVALRGSGNVTRAWDAAVAGWARARLMGDRAASFRADINRLVNDGIIPDRAQQLPPDQRAAAESQMKADWELVKEKWK